METRDYGLFNLLDYNRDLDRKHINKLKDSITEHGYLSSQPILVTPNHEIIDGQHRFIACKEMGLPIQYNIVKEEAQKLIIDLNITQKKWANLDYIHFYAKERDSLYYQNLLEVIEKTNLDVTSALILIKGSKPNKGYRERMIKGELVVTTLQKQNALALYSYIKLMADFLRISVTGRFCKAAVILNATPNFRWEAMLGKAEKFPTKAYNCTTVEETVEMLTELYNYNVRDKRKRI